MTSAVVGIVDYGVGNIGSIGGALHAIGVSWTTGACVGSLKNSDIILLPGVGSFPGAMSAMSASGVAEYVKERVYVGKPVMGICLGMQLLAETSSEITATTGLGLIAGHVQAIPDGGWHIGWNQLKVEGTDSFLTGFDGEYVYFNHSYSLATNQGLVAARAERRRGEAPISAAIESGPLTGLQFHPEKSQCVGRRILQSVIARALDAN